MDSEVTKPDKFKDAYCGKVYTSDTTSEITSMGMQYMYEDAAGFLARDPEYFEFTLHQMRGAQWFTPDEWQAAIKRGNADARYRLEHLYG